MLCPKCGAVNKVNAAFCNSCGVSLSPSSITTDGIQGNGVCQSCGGPVKAGVKFCNRCFENKLDGLKNLQKPSKHNMVINAKIETRNREIRRISLVGPAVVIIIGFFCCLYVIRDSVGIIPGILLLIFGIWWGNTLVNERTRLKSEITELQAELD